jgi:hypothetical protein
MSSDLCQPCIEQQMRWLDTRPSQMYPTFSFTYGSGAAYDTTPAGVRDRLRMNGERWRRLVRTQMAAIAADCRAAGHTATPVGEAA